MKANNQKKAIKPKKTNTQPFNFYGARKTSNPKYYSVSLVRGSDDKREWLNVPVNEKNITLKNGYVLLKLVLLETKLNEDEILHSKTANRNKDEDEDEDESFPF